MKKKILLIPLALLLAISLVATGCPAPTPTTTPAEEPMQILIGGAGVGGTFYPLACGYMTIINNYVPNVRATALATGGSLANCRMIDSGEILIGLVGPSSTAAEAHYGGTEMFPDPMHLDFLSPTYGSWCYVMTIDPEIKTFDDIKGKKVALGEPGAMTATLGEGLFKAMGLEKDVDYTPVMLGEREAVEAIIDGRADVFFNSASKSQPSIVELTTIRDVYFVPIPDEKRDDVIAVQGPGQIIGTVPKGTYKGMDQDYLTVGGVRTIVVDSRADADLVYELTKALWEHVDILGEVVAAGKEFDINNVKADFGLPLHPGALRYYKEAGVITEDPHKG